MTGIPEGWRFEEREELRSGEWRFFYIWDPEERDSVMEDNLVLRGDDAKTGAAGLAELVEDLDLVHHPERVDATGLARRAAHFLVHAESRMSCNFWIVDDPASVAEEFPGAAGELAPPRSESRDGVFTHESWLKTESYVLPVRIRATADGGAEVSQGPPVYRG